MLDQSDADARDMRFAEAWAVSILGVNLNDMFGMRLTSRCSRYCEDPDQCVPINPTEKLPWCVCCWFSGGCDTATLTSSQRGLAEFSLATFGICRSKSIPTLYVVLQLLCSVKMSQALMTVFGRR